MSSRSRFFECTLHLPRHKLTIVQSSSPIFATLQPSSAAASLPNLRNLPLHLQAKLASRHGASVYEYKLRFARSQDAIATASDAP